MKKQKKNEKVQKCTLNGVAEKPQDSSKTSSTNSFFLLLMVVVALSLVCRDANGPDEQNEQNSDKIWN